jgi:transposase-like protein
MDIHKNARLTPHGRERLAKMVLSGQTPEAASEAAGVCPRTGRKWVNRFEQEGLAGLQDRSSRPHQLRQLTPPEVIEHDGHAVALLRDARRGIGRDDGKAGDASAIRRSGHVTILPRAVCGFQPVRSGKAFGASSDHRNDWSRGKPCCVVSIRHLGRAENWSGPRWAPLLDPDNRLGRQASRPYVFARGRPGLGKRYPVGRFYCAHLCRWQGASSRFTCARLSRRGFAWA